MIETRKYSSLPVRAQPVLPIELVFGPEIPSGVRPFPLGAPETILTYSGTAAVYQAFRTLPLERGSTVLCPSYNCGHEIEPLTRLGLRVECYRITTDLEIDMEDVEKRMRSGARALLVTHYFGFAQPLAALRALCDRHGAYLVEDCAHAFLSDNAEGNLGRVGDAAIYSMRKTLPLPNGGAVIFNNPSLRMSGALQPPPRLTTWLKSLDLIGKAVWDRFSARRSPRDLLWLLMLAPLVAGGRAIRALDPRGSIRCYDPDDEDFRFGIEIMGWGISRFSLRLLRKLAWSDAIGRRRSNYRSLALALAGVEGCRVMLPELPEHVCPLYLPVWVEQPIDACRKLARQRIYAAALWHHEHPAVDWERFPEARALKRHVLVLPVHQDVDTEQLERMVTVLRAQ